MSGPLRGQPLFWLEDFQACLEGEHGQWWRDRAERSVEDDEYGASGYAAQGHDSWEMWRDIRQAERAPGEPDELCSNGCVRYSESWMVPNDCPAHGGDLP